MSLLTTISGAASAWTVAGVKAKAFARIDGNGDGSLDKAELQKTFDAVAAKTGREARDAEAVIARIDQNGDGAVTRREIHAHVRELKAAAASTVELAAREGANSR
ncbi:MAG: EF-hand domain-containing protein [Burkholderiales bacterium]|nr:EF-hand domain-containing protein [Burkholderiales bacterium]